MGELLKTGCTTCFDHHYVFPGGRADALLDAQFEAVSYTHLLNGMEVKGVEGEILFYGEDLIENFDRLKYLIGSVPQKAVLHPMLTVQEELKEAAILRLPNDITPQEVNRYVDRTIHQLGLDSKRLTKIQKCSGGEQQRVNICLLYTSPH